MLEGSKNWIEKTQNQTKIKHGYMITKFRSLKRFLIVTAILEGATGLALMTFPEFVSSILLGSSLSDSTGIIIARVAGAALVSLAIACWFLRNSEKINGFLVSLLFYNLASVVFLSYAGLYEGLTGIGLWPAVVAHIALSAWIMRLLYGNKS